MIGYITGFTEEKMKEIKESPFYAQKYAKFIAAADEWITKDPPRIKFSDFHMVVTTGNRSIYEKAWFMHLSALQYLSLAYGFTKDMKYIEPLADIMWNICNMETWAIPYHVGEEEPLEKRYAWLELVSTGVGRNLGEALFFTEEVLPELVVRRVKQQVKDRIIEGFKVCDHWWTRVKNNWASVCVANVFASYLYFATEEEIKEQLPRMLEIGDNFLKGFDADGCCLEGYGYWSYGFSFYCYFADLLLNYTKGEINLFDNPRVHDIALFQENCAINDTQCIRFADCHEAFAPDPALAHYLKKVYPDIQIPSTTPPDDSSPSIRDFAWVDPALQNQTMSELKSRIYHDAQWFIYRSEKYNAAFKGGHNSEFHNHNDVGSFMISKHGKVTFTDPGGGEYTSQYFNADTRYGVLECSARSHSVPIINGILQKEGYRGKSTIFTAKENDFEISINNGYDIETLTSLKRRLLCEAEGITLTDTYEFSEMPTSVVERFVSLVEPKFEEGRVIVGESILLYDPTLYELEYSTDTCVRSGHKLETLHIYDLKAKSLDKNMTLEFKFL